MLEGFFSSSARTVSRCWCLLFLCSNALPLMFPYFSCDDECLIARSLELLLDGGIMILVLKMSFSGAGGQDKMKRNHYGNLVKGHLLNLLGRGIKACAGINPSELEELKKLGCEATLNEESIAPTRFASNIVMLKRFRLVKHGLQEMYERKDENEESSFYDVVHGILIECWTKSSTPLHCLAHSLNPRYYSYDWLSKDPRRIPSHQDSELTFERIKCLKRYFPNSEDRRKVNIEFANFSDGRKGLRTSIL
ncbi:uncharacterized protein G2W53_001458 [Senna tora]|uniref:Uncharacterized protein n=1 Tax=Senna tora TaxID=362788 RepID=A0A834XFV2_9FABA|nr:uncharacterized protein G2W53_001458 [Senna tora]